MLTEILTFVAQILSGLLKKEVCFILSMLILKMKTESWWQKKTKKNQSAGGLFDSLEIANIATNSNISGGTRGGHGGIFPQSEVLSPSPTCYPPIERKKGQKSVPFFAHFWIFAPQPHFAPSMPPKLSGAASAILQAFAAHIDSRKYFFFTYIKDSDPLASFLLMFVTKQKQRPITLSTHHRWTATNKPPWSNNDIDYIFFLPASKVQIKVIPGALTWKVVWVVGYVWRSRPLFTSLTLIRSPVVADSVL